MYPVFVTDSSDDACEEIPSLPGQARHGVNHLISFLEPLVKGVDSLSLKGMLIKIFHKIMNRQNLSFFHPLHLSMTIANLKIKKFNIQAYIHSILCNFEQLLIFLVRVICHRTSLY